MLFPDSNCYHPRPMQDRVPLYVRLPRDQAAALDRLVDATGRRKQHVVSELLADQLQVGRIDVGDRPATTPGEVLTLDELSSLLRAPAAALEMLARAGELPGRQIAGEWRFARAAVLGWLSREGAIERGEGHAEPAGADG